MRPSAVTILIILALLVGLAGARPAAVAGAGPTPDAPRQVRIEAGTHVGLRFDADWDVIASRKVSLQRPSAAHATARRWISGRGTYLAIADGTFAGYWIRESMVAYVTGTVASRRYEPVRRVSFPAGTVAGYRFDASWKLVSAHIGRLASASSAATDRYLVLNGQAYYRIVNGGWAGTWVPADGSFRTRALACHTGPRADATRRVVRTVSGAGREVALTFDMGGRLDPALDIMRYLLLNGVCTTIFPTGSSSLTDTGAAVLAMVKAYPQVFEVGNHTMYHCNLVSGGEGPNCPVSRPSTARVQRELTDAAAIIRAGSGQRPIPYWRPPYGAYDSAVLNAAAGVGYTTTAMWGLDTIDWRHVNAGGPTAAQIAFKVVDGARGGTVVLMHLGGWNTRNALPWMLQRLDSQRDLLPTSLSDVLDLR
jgi:peptidoglycan/xylan/chitin deacetylase (PgdA/CDA1 family)